MWAVSVHACTKEISDPQTENHGTAYILTVSVKFVVTVQSVKSCFSCAVLLPMYVCVSDVTDSLIDPWVINWFLHDN